MSASSSSTSWRAVSGSHPGADETGRNRACCASAGALLVKPQTYMNNSGSPLRLIASWYKIPPERLLVISDDLDLPFGKLRMRRSGSSGGHNGLKSIIACFGEEFPRLRIGIGREAGAEAI